MLADKLANQNVKAVKVGIKNATIFATPLHFGC